MRKTDNKEVVDQRDEMEWNEIKGRLRRRIQKKRNGTNTNHNNINSNNDRLRLRLRLDDDYDVCHFYCITLRPPLHFRIHSFQFQTSTFYLLLLLPPSHQLVITSHHITPILLHSVRTVVSSSGQSIFLSLVSFGIHILINFHLSLSLTPKLIIVAARFCPIIKITYR